MPIKSATAKKAVPPTRSAAPAKKAVAKKAVAKKAAGPVVAAELRVHGVGGSSPASILGLGGDADAELVASGDRTGFWRRSGPVTPETPEIQGYVWGGLTSGSSLQPFWILLLPFSLVNVAGWTHEPLGSISATRIRLIRFTTFLFGLSMTVTYLVWATAILVDSVGTKWLPAKYKTFPYIWTRDGEGLGGFVHHARTTPRVGVVAGATAIFLILVLLGTLASAARRGEGTVESFLQQQPRQTRGQRRGPVGVRAEESLSDAGFFNRARDNGLLLGTHLVWSVAVLAALSVAAWFAATGSPAQSATGQPGYLAFGFFAVGAFQLGLIFLLFLFSAKPSLRGARQARPAVACALAMMFASAMFAGAGRFVDDRLKVNLGQKFRFADVVVYTLAAALVSATIWAIRYGVLLTRRAAASDDPAEPVPPNTAGPGNPPNGATSSQMKTTARFRGLTRGVTKLDAVLTATAAAFWLLAAGLGYARRNDPERLRWEPAAIAGTKLITLIGVGLIAVVWIKRKDPKVRKTVGMIWDLVTFWPRRFHPFAVRPYSEQAVPELRGRILTLRQEHDHVLVSCHSQGAVVTFAAVAPLVSSTDGAIPITLVSYGAPVGGLFRVFFPAYFSPEAMQELHSGVHEWRNFRRRTDPIASEITSVDTDWLWSPGVSPSPGPPLTVPATRAEKDLRPWAMVQTHSNYRSEPAMKQTIDDLRSP